MALIQSRNTRQPFTPSARQPVTRHPPANPLLLHPPVFAYLLLPTSLLASLVFFTRLDLLAVHLLGTPALVGLAHVRRGLDGRDEFEHQVSDTDEANNGPGNVPQHMVVQHNRSGEDIDWKKHEQLVPHRYITRLLEKLTNTTTQEREQERGIAVDVVGDGGQEFQTANH